MLPHPHWKIHTHELLCACVTSHSQYRSQVLTVKPTYLPKENINQYLIYTNGMHSQKTHSCLSRITILSIPGGHGSQTQPFGGCVVMCWTCPIHSGGNHIHNSGKHAKCAQQHESHELHPSIQCNAHGHIAMSYLYIDGNFAGKRNMSTAATTTEMQCFLLQKQLAFTSSQECPCTFSPTAVTSEAWCDTHWWWAVDLQSVCQLKNSKNTASAQTPM